MSIDDLSRFPIKPSRLVELCSLGEDQIRAEHERLMEAARGLRAEIEQLSKVMFLDGRSPKMQELDRNCEKQGELHLFLQCLEKNDQIKELYDELRGLWMLRPGPQHLDFSDIDHLMAKPPKPGLNDWADAMHRAVTQFIPLATRVYDSLQWEDESEAVMRLRLGYRP